MPRSSLIRALVALAVLVLAVLASVTTTPKLGLDLRGGTQIVLQAQDTPQVEVDASVTDRVISVLRNRVDALGVAEPTLVRSGENRVIVELPGLQEPQEASEALGATAQLTFHAVQGLAGRGQQQPSGDGIVLADEDGQRLRLAPSALTGDGVDGADALTDAQQGPGWFVTIDFSGSGGDTWRRLTGEAACSPPGDPRRRVAIVLDQQVISSPQVDPSIQCDGGIAGGTTQITGNFTGTEAKELAALITGGALPVPVEIIERRTVGPTLGADAIDASTEAAIIGLALTGLFIIFIYRLMGLLATLALASYTLIAYAALVTLGATLTLPGLAGFVLAIGLAIDANVLVFERAREEYRPGPRGLRKAVEAGFARAWSAILDSNVTTLLAAGLLFFLAAGPVRGFGVTLSIGVIASMISALVIARVLTTWAASRGLLQRRPALSGLTQAGAVREFLARRNPDIMGRHRLFLVVSALLVVLAGVGIGVRGLALGVEFTGGRQLEYASTAPISVTQARLAVSDVGFPEAVVQGGDDGSGASVLVRTAQISDDDEQRVEDALTELAAAEGGELSQVRDELIGASLGDELRNKALIAFVIALAVQMMYLAFRFRWTFALAAVLAMAHDVVAVVGVFAWLRLPVDGVFLAAVLTIIGLSVNDTVVVFDRIREQRRDHPGQPLGGLSNTAVLQTIPRTVNTGLGAMFILAALALLGGSSLTYFSLALLLGLVVGTWSSVATATPLMLMMEERSPEHKVRRKGPADRYAHIDSGRSVDSADV